MGDGGRGADSLAVEVSELADGVSKGQHFITKHKYLNAIPIK